MAHDSCWKAARVSSGPRAFLDAGVNHTVLPRSVFNDAPPVSNQQSFILRPTIVLQIPSHVCRCWRIGFLSTVGAPMPDGSFQTSPKCGSVPKAGFLDQFPRLDCHLFQSMLRKGASTCFNPFSIHDKGVCHPKAFSIHRQRIYCRLFQSMSRR